MLPNRTITESNEAYRVVLVFHLKPGQADEELRRSLREESFPKRLKRQPGCISLELVKIGEDKTMSVQIWSSAQHWWSALEAAKQAPNGGTAEETILVSRDFFGGSVFAEI
jgi:heme-degrading monooxygenase HmoA